MTLPNVVVAGAPKCGTSSLFTWLVDHPDVCGSRTKETRYLLDETSPMVSRSRSYHERGIAGYEALFADCSRRPAPKVVLEATPDYLYQETARTVLAALRPRPLILFLFRRPSHRVFSHYQFAKHNMSILPASVTFAEFVAAIRRDDELVRTRLTLADTIRYSRYVDYVASWIALFGAAGVRCYLTEDMQADPVTFMRRLAADVGIDPGFYDTYEFRRRNETYAVRNQSLQRVRVFAGTRFGSRRLKDLARPLYERLNTRDESVSPTQDDRRVIAELDQEFAEANEALARLTGLDLRAWG